MRKGFFAVLGLALLLPGLAFAAVLSPLSLEQLAESSAAVLEGRVLDSVSGQEADSGLIFTEHRVQVLGRLAGELVDGVVLVRTPGGEFGGLGQVVPGAPRLAKGEEVLLFLAAVPVAPAGGSAPATGALKVFTPRGGVQGVFRPVKASDGGALLRRDFGQVSFTGGLPQAPARELPRAEVLEALKRAATRKAR